MLSSVFLCSFMCCSSVLARRRETAMNTEFFVVSFSPRHIFTNTKTIESWYGPDRVACHVVGAHAIVWGATIYISALSSWFLTQHIYQALHMACITIGIYWRSEHCRFASPCPSLMFNSTRTLLCGVCNRLTSFSFSTRQVHVYCCSAQVGQRVVNFYTPRRHQRLFTTRSESVTTSHAVGTRTLLGRDRPHLSHE